MWQEDMAAAIAARAAAELPVEALFLAGSLGRGAGDRFSDIDLLGVAAAEHREAVVAGWRPLLESLAPIVFWSERAGPTHLFNAVTGSYQRIDLLLVEPSALAARARDALKPLHDPQRLHDGLRDTIVWAGPDAGRVRWLIEEFIRVLGLLPVGMGRGEYLLGQAGLMLLRGLLVDLLAEEVERADKGGMLHWSERYTPEQMALIARVPMPAPTREEVIAAHLACAAVFVPRARALAARIGLDWPERFEAAMWDHLESELGVGRPAAPPPGSR